MALLNFFDINMPYGIVKDTKGKWLAFNREYTPIGWNKHHLGLDISDDDSYQDLPIRTKYKSSMDTFLKQLIDDSNGVEYDTNGKINKIWFYNDRTNPMNDDIYWDMYLKKIKILSQLKIQTKIRDARKNRYRT